MERKIKRYGWKPDFPDHRDQVREVFGASAMIVLPTSADLRPQMPTIYDQGELGSCTANGICALVEFERKRQHLADDFMPSRLFVYYNERAMEGTISQDSGAEIRDGIKSLNWKGVCHETLMPYDISKFTDKPTSKAYNDAIKHKAVKYARVSQTLNAMRQCLSAGIPFVFGFTAFASLESKELASGQITMLPMPGPSEASIGGHAVVAVGYDDAKRAFLIRNSWGDDWCVSGHFWMPYDFITNTDLADDFWTLSLVSA